MFWVIGIHSHPNLRQPQQRGPEIVAFPFLTALRLLDRAHKGDFGGVIRRATICGPPWGVSGSAKVREHQRRGPDT